MKQGNGIGVIFDMDGVLIDSAAPHLKSWQLLAVEQGGRLTPQQFAATFGRHNQDIIPLLFGAVSPDRMMQLADRKEEIYRNLVRADPPLMPGASGLMRALHSAGAQLAVGSSGPLANIELVLEALGVRDSVSAIVCAADVTRGKPDPQVFTMACTRLSLSPARCVVIEDAPVGIEAARAAGTRPVAICTYHPRQAFPNADLVVDRLADLQIATLHALVQD